MKRWLFTIPAIVALLLGGMYVSDVVGMYWPIGVCGMWSGMLLTLRHRNLFND